MAILTLSTATVSAPESLGRARGFALPRLFAWRTAYAFGPMEAIVLAVYATVLALVIPYHEPWADEAHAWLIASQSSAWEILAQRLHYEGAPPLWHLLLHAYAVVHGPYSGIGWFGAAFATAGVAVMLRWSPFPPIVRLLLPFTFFLQYQYAVIARGYVLFPLLTFTLCTLFRRKEKIVWFALVAGLLANICLQGLLLASLLLALCVYDLYRNQAYAKANNPRLVRSVFVFDIYRTRDFIPVPGLGRRLWIAGTLFVALIVVSFAVSLPAPDLDFAAAPGGGLLHDIAEATIGELPRTQPWAVPDPYPHPEVQPSEPSLLEQPFAWAAWEIDQRPMVDSDGHWGPQSFASQAIEFVVGAASQATWPISTSNPLACLFLAALTGWLYTRRALRFLVPWAVIIFVGQILWVADHHAGMLLIAILAAIWLAAPVPETAQTSGQPRIGTAFLGLFTLILLLQVQWSVVSIRNDRRASYDPGPATAAFLHRYIASHPSASIAGFHFYVDAIQPYFPRSPFLNIPDRFWRWSFNADPDAHHRPTIAARPDLVVYTIEFAVPGQMRNQWAPVARIPSRENQQNLPRDIFVRNLRARGYRETNRFCGERFSRLASSYKDCDLIFQPDPNFIDNGAITAPLNDPIAQTW